MLTSGESLGTKVLRQRYTCAVRERGSESRVPNVLIELNCPPQKHRVVGKHCCGRSSHVIRCRSRSDSKKETAERGMTKSS